MSKNNKMKVRMFQKCENSNSECVPKPETREKNRVRRSGVIVTQISSLF